MFHPCPSRTLRPHFNSSARNDRFIKSVHKVSAPAKEERSRRVVDAALATGDGSRNHDGIRFSPVTDSVTGNAALDKPSAPVLRLRRPPSKPRDPTGPSNPPNDTRVAPAHETSDSAPASSKHTEQQPQPRIPQLSSARVDPPTRRVPRLPGEMEISHLLEILGAGPNAAYENLAKITAVKASKEDPRTISDACRLWWEAAAAMGRMDLAIVAADALGLHLESFKVRRLALAKATRPYCSA